MISLALSVIVEIYIGEAGDCQMLFKNKKGIDKWWGFYDIV
jgi:hypothetical protein